MDEKIKALWANNKLLFLLALPLLLLFLFRDLLFSILVGSARKTFQKATEVDQKLATEQKTAEDAGNAAQADAAELEKKAKSATVDEDWNKNFK